MYGFLLVFCSNFVPKTHRFWDIRSDVNKDLNLKAKDRTKDQTLKAKDRTKDLSFKAKAKDQGL